MSLMIPCKKVCLLLLQAAPVRPMGTTGAPSNRTSDTGSVENSTFASHIRIPHTPHIIGIPALHAAAAANATAQHSMHTLACGSN